MNENWEMAECFVQGWVFDTRGNKNWWVTEKVLRQRDLTVTLMEGEEIGEKWYTNVLWLSGNKSVIKRWRDNPFHFKHNSMQKETTDWICDRPFVWDTQTKSNYTQGSKLWSTSAIESAQKFYLLTTQPHWNNNCKSWWSHMHDLEPRLYV